MAFGLIIATLISRSIVRPLRQALDLADAIAEGDLTRSVEVSGHDEFARLAQRLNKMQGNLRGTLSGLQAATTGLNDEVRRLAMASGEGARQAEEKLDQVSQVSTAIREMTASISDVAAGAEAVAASAAESRTVALSAQEAMRKALTTGEDAVARVAQSGQAIAALTDEIRSVSEFTQVIRDIADQTNLLALNAAIEAARAGEQGRGFAVVADEVRKLSERTAISTRSIAETVKGIESRARDVVQTIEQVGAAVSSGLHSNEESHAVFERIARSADDVAGQIAQIAESTREQSSSSAITSQAIEQISRLSRNSSETLHHLDQAARGVEGASGNLREIMTRFRV
ncbi:MAG: methyl-accepting chemotaxis protein [Zoogloea sp.]|nr:methyl-accepting chemotaxis protein [Zoogloea sp.]